MLSYARASGLNLLFINSSINDVEFGNKLDVPGVIISEGRMEEGSVAPLGE